MKQMHLLIMTWSYVVTTKRFSLNGLVKMSVSLDTSMTIQKCCSFFICNRLVRLVWHSNMDNNSTLVLHCIQFLVCKKMHNCTVFMFCLVSLEHDNTLGSCVLMPAILLDVLASCPFPHFFICTQLISMNLINVMNIDCLSPTICGTTCGSLTLGFASEAATGDTATPGGCFKSQPYILAMPSIVSLFCSHCFWLSF